MRNWIKAKLIPRPAYFFIYHIAFPASSPYKAGTLQKTARNELLSNVHNTLDHNTKVTFSAIRVVQLASRARSTSLREEKPHMSTNTANAFLWLSLFILLAHKLMKAKGSIQPHTSQYCSPPFPSENCKIQLLFNNATKPYKILFFWRYASKNCKSNQARHLLEEQQLRA